MENIFNKYLSAVDKNHTDCVVHNTQRSEAEEEEGLGWLQGSSRTPEVDSVMLETTELRTNATNCKAVTELGPK